MENREFISAANLPTTEAEEVDVLCVENGELKRKPGASLGGNYDAILRSSMHPYYGGGVDCWTVEKCDFEAIKAKINGGELAKAKIVHQYNYGNDYVEVCEATAFQYDPANDYIRIIYPSITGSNAYRHISSICINASGAVVEFGWQYV